MAYFTIENRPKKVNTNPGDMYLNVYQEEINSKGQIKLKKTGVKNIYDLIQQDIESTKIENILHQVAMGDLSALKQREVTYFDATTMPKTLMEIQNIGLQAKQEFEDFPTEVKEMFHNSCEEYIASMGSQEFFDKMSKYNKKIADIEEAGSMKAYQKKVADQAKFEMDVAAKKGEATE